jgi:uncharacterized protein YndB with AHSA1/START domain
MSDERSITHDRMTMERTYAAPRERVFAAWTDAAAKRAWMLGSEDEFDAREYELDFREGGREWIRGEGGGDVYTYEARYEDIVDNERIVYSYYMLRGEVRMSVSVTSVEFTDEDGRTKLVLTEHGMYLDGQDQPALRFEGISGQLDALGPWLARSGSA